MQELDSHCLKDPCEEKHVTDMANVPMSPNAVALTGLRSYTKYRIRVQATNVTAKDRTVVTTPYGNYSNPINETTYEGGKENIILNSKTRLTARVRMTS